MWSRVNGHRWHADDYYYSGPEDLDDAVFLDRVRLDAGALQAISDIIESVPPPPPICMSSNKGVVV